MPSSSNHSPRAIDPVSSDPNLDELKRRARRRLVGAVVIALAAAVFVPMLLESEQKPLGDDVAVRIPPVDDGKFVNQLNAPGKTAPVPIQPPAQAAVAPQSKADAMPATTTQPGRADASSAPVAAPGAGTAPGSTSSSPAAPATGAAASTAAPRKSLADAEQRVLGANAASKSAAPTTPAKTSAPAAASTPVAKGASPADTKADATTAAKAAGAAGSFIVQLAAFSDDKGANSLSNRLKKSGYPAFIEPVTTSHGTLWRVRVGPFPSRDDANGARDKLKRDGFNGLVAANPR